MLRVLQVADHEVVEKRPGEVVGCMRPKEGPDGCGTSRHCVTCGAVSAILESQRHNTQVVRECRILTEEDSGPGAMDLRVAATPIEVDGERFIVAAVEDISQPKRMAVLQRVFFHDVLNTAGCISGYADYLAKEREAVDEVCGLLTHLSEQLVEEIHAQRDLVLAESGDLVLQADMLTTKHVVDELRQQYLKNPVATERKIELGQVWSGIIWTDRRLLMRILGNMLKNALEAISPGQAVTIECCNRQEDVVFAVHNPGVMPEEVQLQMFQRSFSTKGQTGRGIGTYSMKLLGERYLGGRVEFVSRFPEGATFALSLPKSRR
jgi:signal transduction histidine kinase